MATRNRSDSYMRIDRGPEDRYRRTRVYNDSLVSVGRLRYGVWRPPDIDVEDAERHTVTSQDVGHMDLIAWLHYGKGNEHLWWAIAWVNRIANPVTDMYVGQQLLIPPVGEIAAALEKVI